MPDAALAERVWHGAGAKASLARAVLAPAALLYGGVMRARTLLYDARVLPSHAPRIPAVSVGNLSVGGTGKTPVAAWVARELAARGAHPAVVLRGYGGDEPLVHERLNPDIPIVADPDRVRGVSRAAAQGADVAVLDDAFQHRRIRRAADIVLLSADVSDGPWRLLPAGPWREPIGALSRASLALVTRKAAPAERVDELLRAIDRARPSLPVAVARLEPDGLRAATGEGDLAIASLAGRDILAISAIGDPRAFAAQLRALGARVTERAFGDHHGYTAADAFAIAAALRPGALAVCTLKDAVKLAPLWPRAAPRLWYVSQRVVVERGERALGALLDTVVQLRLPPTPAPAPPAKPSPYGNRPSTSDP